MCHAELSAVALTLTRTHYMRSDISAFDTHTHTRTLQITTGQSNMGMQVGPSERGFDADNATAEAAATGNMAASVHMHMAVTVHYSNRCNRVFMPEQP